MTNINQILKCFSKPLKIIIPQKIFQSGSTIYIFPIGIIILTPREHRRPYGILHFEGLLPRALRFSKRLIKNSDTSRTSVSYYCTCRNIHLPNGLKPVPIHDNLKINYHHMQSNETINIFKNPAGGFKAAGGVLYQSVLTKNYCLISFSILICLPLSTRTIYTPLGLPDRSNSYRF